jgi:hypothetical protein
VAPESDSILRSVESHPVTRWSAVVIVVPIGRNRVPSHWWGVWLVSMIQKSLAARASAPPI